MSPDNWNEMSVEDQIDWLRAALHELQVSRGNALQDLVDRVDDLTKHVLMLLRSSNA